MNQIEENIVIQNSQVSEDYPSILLQQFEKELEDIYNTYNIPKILTERINISQYYQLVQKKEQIYTETRKIQKSNMETAEQVRQQEKIIDDLIKEIQSIQKGKLHTDKLWGQIKDKKCDITHKISDYEKDHQIELEKVSRNQKENQEKLKQEINELLEEHIKFENKKQAKLNEQCIIYQQKIENIKRQLKRRQREREDQDLKLKQDRIDSLKASIKRLQNYIRNDAMEKKKSGVCRLPI